MQIVDNLAISLLSKPFTVLYGPSGTGKTRAGIELANMINSTYYSYNWYEIEVNKNGHIINGTTDEFRKMVKKNEDKGNNFIVRNQKYQASNVTLEFCNELNITDEDQKYLLIADPTNLQLAANVNTNISCHKVIPVGSNWNDNKPLIGYQNPFGPNNQTVYEITPFLELLILANHPDNFNKPFFAILDEMNLSHVEYYLSDILSLMETSNHSKNELLSFNQLKMIEKTLSSHPDSYSQLLLESIRELLKNERGLPLTPNFFIIGTINIDETTQMLSNKVLDRANLIKIDTITPSDSLKDNGYSSNFSKEEMAAKFEKLLDFKRTYNVDEDFYSIYSGLSTTNKINTLDPQKVLALLDSIYKELHLIDQQFGYRIVKETFIYLTVGLLFYGNDSYLIDLLNNTLIQKVLVKLNGNRRILGNTIQNLLTLLEEQKTLLEGIDDINFNDTVKRLNNLSARLNLRGQASFIS